MPADWIALGEHGARHALADDGDFWDVAVSCGPKSRPASRGICKAEKYPLVMTLWFTQHVRGLFGAGHEHATAPTALMEDKRGEAGAVNSRQRIHSFRDLPVESVYARFVVFIAGRAFVQMEKEHVLLVEAEIDACEIDQTAQEEACGDDEQKREGYLGDDERLCQQSFTAYRACTLPIFERRASVPDESRALRGWSRRAALSRV